VSESFEYDIGRMVLCDLCSKDFTDLPACGGFIFQSKGVCPECAPRFLALAEQHDETRYIRATCPDGQSFSDFCRAYRGANNIIRVTRLPI
jgi:hypothetical protein